MTEQSHRSPPPPPPPLQPGLPITPAETVEFGQSLATGTRRYNDMVQSVQGNQFLSDQDMAARRQNFHDHYQVAPAREQPYLGDSAQQVTSTELPNGLYINRIDTTAAEIRAWHNANSDGAPPPWSLKSSDIQYLLYEQAFGQHPITPLRCVVRMNVASGTGSKVVTHIGKFNPARVGMTLTPGDHHPWQVVGTAGPVTATTADFFYAFLGSENAVSSIWLIREHGRRLGINGIEKVVVMTVQNIAIHFTHPR
jgi:hypothetical protein